MLMRADLVLSWGGENLAKLTEGLHRVQPGAVVSVIERRDDGTPAIIRWEHEAPSPYGSDCFELWRTFTAMIRRQWSRDAADSAVHEASFVIFDGYGKRIGRLEGTLEDSGWRHLVDGTPIHCGEGLDLMMPDGSWLKGRYEMDRVSDGIPIPLFCTRCYRGDITTRITDHMVVRQTQRS